MEVLVHFDHICIQWASFYEYKSTSCLYITHVHIFVCSKPLFSLNTYRNQREAYVTLA